jgi:hypothetical protein
MNSSEQVLAPDIVIFFPTKQRFFNIEAIRSWLIRFGNPLFQPVCRYYRKEVKQMSATPPSGIVAFHPVVRN